MLIFSYVCSLGAFIYDSNPGSGGGAIAFNATGVLTIGKNNNYDNLHIFQRGSFFRKCLFLQLMNHLHKDKGKQIEI